MILAASEPQIAWSIFLGSTIEDFGPLRVEVTKALVERGVAFCNPCENWIDSFEDVPTMCLRNLNQANGYMLLLGHWYGSVQTGEESSITEMEFDWALARWRGAQPTCIAVMLPKINSQIDLEMQKRATKIVDTRKIDQAKHSKRIEDFRRRVTDSWHKVNFFSDVQELREYAIVVGLQWRYGSFRDAARGGQQHSEIEMASRPDEASLGMLGRERQIQAMEQALAELKIGQNRALAVLVHGDDQAGQRAFLAHLERKLLRPFRPERRGRRLPHTFLDLGGLCAWVAQSLGLPSTNENTPASVAERVAIKLREHPMCLVLDGAAAYNGGILAFHNQFWKPFFEELSKQFDFLPFNHRMVAVLTDYSGSDQQWSSVACNADDDIDDHDRSLLLALPKLGSFTKSQVTLWLSKMNYADDPPGSLNEVAERAITNDLGARDLIPMKVLDRLRFEQLVPNENMP